MPPKRQARKSSRKSKRGSKRRSRSRKSTRSNASRTGRSSGGVAGLPSCPLKIGLRQVRDRKTGRCRLVSQNLQKLTPDRRKLSKLAIDLDKLSDQTIANLEIARQATIALQNNPLGKRAYSVLEKQTDKLDDLIIKSGKLFQNGQRIISDGSSESGVVSDTKKIINAAKTSARQVANSFHSIVKLLDIQQNTNNSNAITRQAQSTQRQIEQAQKASAEADDTAANSLKTALGVVGGLAAGAALIGGGLALAKQLRGKPEEEDQFFDAEEEPIDVEKERQVRQVVMTRSGQPEQPSPFGRPAAVPVPIPTGGRESLRPQQESTSEALRNVRNVEQDQLKAVSKESESIQRRLEAKERTFNILKKQLPSIQKRFVVKRDIFQTKLRDFEEKMDVAAQLSVQISNEISQIGQVRKQIVEFNNRLTEESRKFKGNVSDVAALNRISEEINTTNRSLDELTRELDQVKQETIDKNDRFKRLILELSDSIGEIRQTMGSFETDVTVIKDAHEQLTTLSSEIKAIREELDLSTRRFFFMDAFKVDDINIPLNIQSLRERVASLEQKLGELQAESRQYDAQLKAQLAIPDPQRIKLLVSETDINRRREQLEQEAGVRAQRLRKTLPSERSQDTIGDLARQSNLSEDVDAIVGAIRPRYNKAVLNDTERTRFIKDIENTLKDTGKFASIKVSRSLSVNVGPKSRQFLQLILDDLKSQTPGTSAAPVPMSPTVPSVSQDSIWEDFINDINDDSVKFDSKIAKITAWIGNGSIISEGKFIRVERTPERRQQLKTVYNELISDPRYKSETSSRSFRAKRRNIDKALE